MCCQGGLVEAEAPRNVPWSCREVSLAASWRFSNPCALHLKNGDSYCNDDSYDDDSYDDDSYCNDEDYDDDYNDGNSDDDCNNNDNNGNYSE